MRVSVAYADPGRAALVEVDVPPGARVHDAVTASGLVERLALAADTLTFAIFGQRARASTPLAEGDRVELLRPLTADPKEVRRRRAQENPLPTVPSMPKKRPPGPLDGGA